MKKTIMDNQEIMEITTSIMTDEYVLTDEEYFALREEYEQYLVDRYGDVYPY